MDTRGINGLAFRNNRDGLPMLVGDYTQTKPFEKMRVRALACSVLICGFASRVSPSASMFVSHLAAALLAACGFVPAVRFCLPEPHALTLCLSALQNSGAVQEACCRLLANIIETASACSPSCSCMQRAPRWTPPRCCC